MPRGISLLSITTGADRAPWHHIRTELLALPPRANGVARGISLDRMLGIDLNYRRVSPGPAAFRWTGPLALPL